MCWSHQSLLNSTSKPFWTHSWCSCRFCLEVQGSGLSLQLCLMNHEYSFLVVAMTCRAGVAKVYIMHKHLVLSIELILYCKFATVKLFKKVLFRAWTLRQSKLHAELSCPMESKHESRVYTVYCSNGEVKSQLSPPPPLEYMVIIRNKNNVWSNPSTSHCLCKGHFNLFKVNDTVTWYTCWSCVSKITWLQISF